MRSSFLLFPTRFIKRNENLQADQENAFHLGLNNIKKKRFYEDERAAIVNNGVKNITVVQIGTTLNKVSNIHCQFFKNS